MNQLNRISKDRQKYTIQQRPFETAQQKATKRANKLLDSKRQQEVERIAAEKLGNHEKKCPICVQPFRDVNVFMAHLSKCNMVESSNDEDESTKDIDMEQNCIKTSDEKYNSSPEDQQTKSIKHTLPSDDATIKVFHCSFTKTSKHENDFKYIQMMLY